MRFASLDQWLSWQERLHSSSIDLGLDRIQAVLASLDLEKPPFRVITVGGTNGKGSVAMYSAGILTAAGQSVGLYTSPHLTKYNERIRIDGNDADDAEICRAFEEVDQARGDTSLTYFEFGTLAAFVVFRNRDIDVAVLEVGLGGRLDAVNAIDSDVAVVVSVGMDHMDWLGDSIDQIAREKGGIFRQGKPAIIGQAAAPPALLEVAGKSGAELQVIGRDFSWQAEGDTWSWAGKGRAFAALPQARMLGEHQFGNAATAIAAVIELEPDIDPTAVSEGIRNGRLAGRLEALDVDPQHYPRIFMDVGHNAAAADVISDALELEDRSVRAVIGMLDDKDAHGFASALSYTVIAWYPVTLDGYRGQTAESLAERMPAGLPIAGHYRNVEAGVRAALEDASPDELLLICGSFHTVGEWMACGLYSSLRQAKD